MSPFSCCTLSPTGGLLSYHHLSPHQLWHCACFTFHPTNYGTAPVSHAFKSEMCMCVRVKLPCTKDLRSQGRISLLCVCVCVFLRENKSTGVSRFLLTGTQMWSRQFDDITESDASSVTKSNQVWASGEKEAQD